MLEFLARAKVVLGAAITYITAIAMGVTIAANEIAKAAPEGSEDVVAWMLRAASLLTAVVAMIRSHTPVSPDMRGLLPPKITSVRSRTKRA